MRVWVCACVTKHSHCVHVPELRIYDSPPIRLVQHVSRDIVFSP